MFVPPEARERNLEEEVNKVPSHDPPAKKQRIETTAYVLYSLFGENEVDNYIAAEELFLKCAMPYFNVQDKKDFQQLLQQAKDRQPKAPG